MTHDGVQWHVVVQYLSFLEWEYGWEQATSPSSCCLGPILPLGGIMDVWRASGFKADIWMRGVTDVAGVASWRWTTSQQAWR
jgi:hypothetical protein